MVQTWGQITPKGVVFPPGLLHKPHGTSRFHWRGRQKELLYETAPAADRLFGRNRPNLLYMCLLPSGSTIVPHSGRRVSTAAVCRLIAMLRFSRDVGSVLIYPIPTFLAPVLGQHDTKLGCF